MSLDVLLTDCQLWQSAAKFLCNMSQFLELCLLFPPIVTHYFFPQPLIWLRQKGKETFSTLSSNKNNFIVLISFWLKV